MDRRRTTSFDVYQQNPYGRVRSTSSVDRYTSRRISTASYFQPQNIRESREIKPEEDYYAWQQYYPIQPQQHYVQVQQYQQPPLQYPPYQQYYDQKQLNSYIPQAQIYQDYTEEAPQPLDKDFRTFLAETKRTQRSAMTCFINISVQIQLLKYQFKITVDTSVSIDYLAKQIEADFNYQIEELEGKKITPLLVRLVLNSQNQPIHFDQIVGDVLSTNDIIVVIHSEKQLDEVQSNLTHSGMLLALDRYRESIDQDDLLLQKILKSTEGFKYFAEYCYKEYSLEYLLFWLEVELFVESPPETWLLIARYIDKTYLLKNSPLRINLRRDIIDDIPPPTYDNVQRDQTLFDEAQQDAYNVMKLHLLHGFMLTNTYLKWTNKDFTPDYNLMMELTKADYIDALELPENTPTSRLDFCRTVRESVLERVCGRYFHTFPFTGRYFQSISNTPLKMKLVTKEKKLTKFFGEKPFFEEIQRQSGPQTRHSMSTTEFRVSMDQNEQLERRSDDLKAQKIKKLDKLEGFFGGRPPSSMERTTSQSSINNTSVPRSPVFKKSQELLNAKSTDSMDADLKFHAKNELTDEEKRILMKRQKKLAGVLGTNVDDDIMKSQKTVPEPVPTIDIQPLEEFGDNPALLEFQSLVQNYFDDFSNLANRSSTVTTTSNGNLTKSTGNLSNTTPEKEVRMRRIDKLYNLLGERIDPTVLEKSRLSVLANKSKSPSEKHQNRKRFDKLQQKFGESIPVDAINSTVDYSKRTEEHIAGFKTLERIMNNRTTLHRMISEIYDNGPLDTKKENVEDDEDDEDLDEQSKVNKQRKLNKLQKFFGNNLSPALLFEQTILKDLEETINEEYSGREEYNQLRSELDLLKAKAQTMNVVAPSTAFYTSPDVVQRKDSFNTAMAKRKPARMATPAKEKDLKTLVLVDAHNSYKSLNELSSPRSSFRNAKNAVSSKFKKHSTSIGLRSTQSLVDVDSGNRTSDYTAYATRPRKNSNESTSREVTLSRDRTDRLDIKPDDHRAKSIGSEILNDYMSQ